VVAEISVPDELRPQGADLPLIWPSPLPARELHLIVSRCPPRNATRSFMLRFITSRRFLFRLAVVLAIAVGAGEAWQNWPTIQASWAKATTSHPESADTPTPKAKVELVPGEPYTVRIPAALLEKPRGREQARFATAVVTDAPTPEPLRLMGTTVPDPNRNVRVHSLFPGHIVKMGLRGEMTKTSERLSTVPENGLRVNDVVRKGQILAVVSSQAAGALKTNLVNCIVQLRNDRIVLDRYLQSEKDAPGVLTKTTITQAEQKVQGDENAVRDAVRSLRSNQFTEEEIDLVRQEGESIKNLDALPSLKVDQTWAEYQIRAPYDAVIVENNASIGLVVDTSLDIFKLAKIDRLQIQANVYEEDLPKLQDIDRDALEAEAAAVPPGGTEGSEGMEGVVRAAGDRVRAWSISFQATGEQGFPGSFEKLSLVIDSMQHTGSVTGWVDNSQRRLFLGQFVIAIVPLKKDPNLVGVPTGAVVEAADGQYLFVQTSPGVFSRRKVDVVVRGREQILIRRPVSAMIGIAGPAGLFGPIPVGAVVLARGAVELSGELDDLQTDAKK